MHTVMAVARSQAADSPRFTRRLADTSRDVPVMEIGGVASIRPKKPASSATESRRLLCLRAREGEPRTGALEGRRFSADRYPTGRVSADWGVDSTAPSQFGESAPHMCVLALPVN